MSVPEGQENQHPPDAEVPARRPEAEPATAAPAEGRPTAPAPQEPAPTVEELDDRWRRCMAELDNQRKRHAKEIQRERESERVRTASAFLPVIDHLELALSHADADAGAIVEGVRAVRDQVVQILRDLGYPRHDETGVPFDPARHEVVTVVDDPDAAPGTVVRVLRPGYGEPGRQLRAAAVAVSRKQE